MLAMFPRGARFYGRCGVHSNADEVLDSMIVIETGDGRQLESTGR